jgi:16S rRNA (cytosine1402-N4)-methyltransferase
MRSLSTSRVGVPFSARFHSARTGRHPGGTLVEGLRMSSSARPPTFHHIPVMLDEIVEVFAPVPAGVVLDGTVGGAGHSRALLEAYPRLRVVGLDQDPDAVAAATAVLAPFGDRATVVGARFDHFAEVLDRLGIGTLSGALLDLGVSSPQLDRADRGFSYRGAGPLDMRMDPGADRSAADIVNGWSQRDLVALFAENGEGRFARRIVNAVIAARPISTTIQLAEIVRGAIPAAVRRTGGHPARRVFQALRVAVNEELEVLPGTIDAIVDRLTPGGRAAVLAYHSGEDRIVKDRFRAAATGGCICPPGLPCVCGAEPTARLVHRGARRPGAPEVERTRRAESARLRTVERLPEDPV